MVVIDLVAKNSKIRLAGLWLRGEELGRKNMAGQGRGLSSGLRVRWLTMRLIAIASIVAYCIHLLPPRRSGLRRGGFLFRYRTRLGAHSRRFHLFGKEPRATTRTQSEGRGRVFGRFPRNRQVPKTTPENADRVIISSSRDDEGRMKGTSLAQFTLSISKC